MGVTVVVPKKTHKLSLVQFKNREILKKYLGLKNMQKLKMKFQKSKKRQKRKVVRSSWNFLKNKWFKV